MASRKTTTKGASKRSSGKASKGAAAAAPSAQTAQPCAPGVCDPQRTQGIRAPAPKGAAPQILVNLEGPGVFVAAHVSKQGGENDLTFVNLEIDGRNVTSISFAAARNLGFTQQNPYGLVMLQSAAVENLTIGFPVPLAFRRSLRLTAVVNENGVVQLLGNVIHGR